MDINDDLIGQLLINSDFELSNSDCDDVVDSDINPDFTIENNGHGNSDTTHISGNNVVRILILCTYNIKFFLSK